MIKILKTGAALALLLCALRAAPMDAASPSLIDNGDFSQPNAKGDWPAGWGSRDPSGGITWETEAGPGGASRRYLHFAAPDAPRALLLYRTAIIPEDCKAIEISFVYRTAGLRKGDTLPGDARAAFNYLDPTPDTGGARPRPPASIVFSALATQWTTVSRRCLVPAGAANLQLMPGLWSVKAGALDLAEVRVTALPASEAAALAAARDAEAKQKADREALIARDLLLPPRTPGIKVSGNRLVTVADGRPVWLQGLCVDSMEWGPGENIRWSVRYAIDQWHANVIRLPVNVDYWFGRGKYQRPGSAESYRRTVDDLVRLAAGKGAWLVLDLHAFGPAFPKHLAFWKDAAARYKNNPAVLFELFNEPVGVSWKLWRDGGSLTGPDNRHADNNPVAIPVKVESDTAIGLQTILDAIRAAGARNVVIAGGLDWGYDLGGILDGHALSDPHGDGVVYSSHVYPWEKDWREKFLNTAARYPLFIGEVGCPPDYDRFQFIPSDQRYPLEGWATDMIALIQKHRLNWTGFSFHPRCGPMAISDWNYTPTPYWGVYVKEALQGRPFELKALR